MKTLRFNQDGSSLAIGSDNGQYKVYNCDPFGVCYEPEIMQNDQIGRVDSSGSKDLKNDGYVLVEMLFATSLVATVRATEMPEIETKRLKIVNTKRHSIICELVFPSAIVDVLMNRKRLCVLLEAGHIYIYDISCMKQLDVIDTGSTAETTDRRRARMSLSTDDCSILCYSRPNNSNSSSGGVDATPEVSQPYRDIVVYDALECKPINYLHNLHVGSIAALTVSTDGKILATASNKGTVVRVFSTESSDENNSQSGSILYEFRRGTKPCKIHQLLFNKESTLLGCVGNTDTIHLFKLDDLDTANPTAVQMHDSEPLEDSSEINNHSNNSNNTATVSNTTIQGKKLISYFSHKIKKTISNQNMSRDFAHISTSSNSEGENSPTPVQNSKSGHNNSNAVKNTSSKDINNYNKNSGARYIIGFPQEFNNQIYVAGDNGSFDVFSLPKNGGKCVLAKSNRWSV
ncbi:hypothetical protein TBLA_0H03870 [Henningerozyma blattae CBS 6284]|uniref:Autophagy-related protein 21 n=1 Tax=Henningerozyma blattae (strain ATCC 34711 / CBS 6284 / DSM 70876 / NBRC 10599 / NRRL Y-10934 / UCD 77-7) TaxID=1071380 RepID=I2H8G6_HENB6|nr:hypothetical protein TBLA_0H03870 [Tetrapisispora blattae CBS 6284]CCH62668.1 hypothetical protein TBLA_0H03870 [Tetrapisispora blattae CBS 6284]